MKKGPHVCRKIPLLYEQSSVCRMECLQCELDAMKPSVLQWVNVAVRLNLPDDVVTEVACRMRSFWVHPVYSALSSKDNTNPILVICDNPSVARMGMRPFRSKAVGKFRNCYQCNGRMVCLCGSDEEAGFVLDSLGNVDDARVFKIMGYDVAM
jgi:hypothetical protein